MSIGLLNELLNARPSYPAGQGMQIIMIDRKRLVRNPDNQIYLIGDVSRLKEDIKTNGIRQPLEVIDLEDGNYKLIGGERRLTACEELTAEGDDRFEALPCTILHCKDPDDDKIALITANATARDLTDGERLAQYEALKEILSRRKKNGQLEGKVRDELCRILGLSAGAAARLNAIAENCDGKIKQQLRDGEISLMGAYRAAQAIIAHRSAGDAEAVEMIQENAKIFEPSETVPKKPVESPYQNPAPDQPEPKEPLKEQPEPHGRRTMIQLAKRTLSRSAPWHFDRNLWIYKLDFYEQDLPGGAKLLRMDDLGRDAVGLASGEHTRYAILYSDGNFFTIGWVLHDEAMEKLVQYFELT